MDYQKQMDEVLVKLLPEYERHTYNGDVALSEAKAKLTDLFIKMVEEVIGEYEGGDLVLRSEHRRIRQALIEALSGKERGENMSNEDNIPEVISPEEINPNGVYGNDNDWDD